MKIGYIRVSTQEQNVARQEVILQELGVEKIFIDKASGKDTDRKELQTMLQFIREGDVVIVESYSRLARNTKQLLEIVALFKNKGVEFVSKKEAIDTATPAVKFMLTIFAGLYEFEREYSLERQAEGIELAKKAGKYKGRKPIEVDRAKFEPLYSEWKQGKITAIKMRKELGLTATTFYRKVKLYENSR